MLSTLLGSVVLLAPGCRTMSVPKLESQQADLYAQHKEIGGLVVAVNPMTQREEIKQNFNTDLLDEGLLPILVVAENRNPSSSFIIAKEKVFVLNEDTGATNASGSKRVAVGQATTGGVLSVVGAGGLVGLIGAKLGSDAQVIQHNLRDKEFYSRTLEPGQKAQGFIYFQFTQKTPPSGSYHLVAQIKNSSTDEVTPFDFEVNLNLTKP